MAQLMSHYISKYEICSLPVCHQNQKSRQTCNYEEKLSITQMCLILIPEFFSGNLGKFYLPMTQSRKPGRICHMTLNLNRKISDCTSSPYKKEKTKFKDSSCLQRHKTLHTKNVSITQAREHVQHINRFLGLGLICSVWNEARKNSRDEWAGALNEAGFKKGFLF